jgi:hypothetical protein
MDNGVKKMAQWWQNWYKCSKKLTTVSKLAQWCQNGTIVAKKWTTVSKNGTMVAKLVQM